MDRVVLPINNPPAGQTPAEAQAALQVARTQWWTAYDTYIETGGDQAATMLREGPNQQNVRLAKSAGVLPQSTNDVWTDIFNAGKGWFLPSDALGWPGYASWGFGKRGMAFGASVKFLQQIQIGRFAPRDALGRFVSPGELSWWQRAAAVTEDSSWIPKSGQAGAYSAWGTAGKWAGRAGVAVGVRHRRVGPVDPRRERPEPRHRPARSAAPPGAAVSQRRAVGPALRREPRRAPRSAACSPVRAPSSAVSSAASSAVSSAPAWRAVWRTRPWTSPATWPTRRATSSTTSAASSVASSRWTWPAGCGSCWASWRVPSRCGAGSAVLRERVGGSGGPATTRWCSERLPGFGLLLVVGGLYRLLGSGAEAFLVPLFVVGAAVTFIGVIHPRWWGPGWFRRAPSGRSRMRGA